jgi:hypothetical protein
MMRFKEASFTSVSRFDTQNKWRYGDSTEFSFIAFYRFNSTKSPGVSRETNEIKALGRTRLDYDLTEQLFIFGIATVEYGDYHRYLQQPARERHAAQQLYLDAGALLPVLSKPNSDS